VAAILIDRHDPFWPTNATAVASPFVDRSVPLKTLLRWSEALSGIARTGLGFTESLYEQERFEEILKVAADIRAEADEVPGDESYANGLVANWLDTVGKGVPGYITPKVAVGAAVGNDKGELLLIQRADSGIWLYPTGWCDIGYSAAEVAVKEVEEEAGIIVEPVRLIGLLDGLRLGMSDIGFYSILFYCRAIGGELRPHPLETRDVGWFTRDNLPPSLIGSARWGDHVFAAIEGEHRDVFYDRVRQPLWRGDPSTT
jgi:ADP-ribose pyrophosphatase YjhB (NUDIX family)